MDASTDPKGARMALRGGVGTKESRMADLREVLIFCVMYSGIVAFTLWQTVVQRREVSERD
jgi:hypothetical protein